MNPKAKKPDVYKRGMIIDVDLPKQPLSQLTDSQRRDGIGVEHHGHHRCVVISSNDLNSVQSRWLIVIPLTSIREAKAGPWVRVLSSGEMVHALIEQIRYADRARCGKQYGCVSDYDIGQIVKELKQVLDL